MSTSTHHWRGRALVLSACAVGGLLFTATPAAAGQAPQVNPSERASALVTPAVVYIEAQWSGYVIDQTGTPFNNGQPYQFTARCTGFGVNPNGYIATAGHCVDPGKEGIRSDLIAEAAKEAQSVNPTLSMDDILQFGDTNWQVEGEQSGSDPQVKFTIQGSNADAGESSTAAKPARLVDFRPLSEGDVALLKTDSTSQPSLELAPDSDVEIGTQVLSVGYPASTDEVTDTSAAPTNKDGEVSAKKTVGSVPVYETSAALSQGMSGGPTVDMQGRVIGINSFKPSDESQAFNFIAPASGLTELLGRNGVKAQLGDNDKLYRQGLNDYFAGHYTDAMASFDKLTKLDPAFTQAKEFSSKALRDRDKFGDVDEGGLLMPLLIGGGAALLIAAAVAALLVMRRKRGSGGQGGGQVPANGPTPDGGQQVHTGPVSPPVGIPRQDPVYPQGYQQNPPQHAPQHQAQSPVSTAPTQTMAPVYQQPVSDAIPVQQPASNPFPAQQAPQTQQAPQSLQTPSNGIPSISGGELIGGGEATAVRERISTTETQQQAATRFCPNCGNRHPLGARFCHNCGSDVS